MHMHFFSVNLSLCYAAVLTVIPLSYIISAQNMTKKKLFDQMTKTVIFLCQVTKIIIKNKLFKTKKINYFTAKKQ